MKTKLCLCILAVLLTAPLEVALAQNNFVVSNGGAPAMPQQIDPTPGLPIPPSAP